ncbi:MAG: ATP-dependent DNA helicase [Actinomycetota bacterium]|nr:ATP-dependent DNA helicase [Actinomycetota bacterium]
MDETRSSTGRDLGTDLVEASAIALEEACGSLPGGGERRPGQEAMTRRVAEAIEAGAHLVVRAGTGTGKSMAYLIPAITSGRTTVVATATKALQDQLATKDLPFLQEHLAPHLGRSFTFSILKGRSNYVCVQRLAEVAAAESGQQQFDGLAESADAEQLAAIAEWAGETDTGDRSDLPLEPSASTWAAVSVSSQECPGAARCPSGEACFAEAARVRAEASDVVVTNLHLYGIDLATEGSILPEHDLAVLDEAHQTEDVVARAVGCELRSGRFQALVHRARSILVGSSAVEDVAEVAERVDDALVQHLGDRVVPADLGDLRSALELASTRLSALHAELIAVPQDGPGDVTARRARALRNCEVLSDDVSAALDLDGGPIPGQKVAWTEGSAHRPCLQVAPVDVASVLDQRLWPLRTVVLTSATIPANLPDRLGLVDHDHRYEDVGSPFDFENQSLLYCATAMPDPRDDAFLDACHDEIERLATATGGRMLALFTSRRALDAAVDALRDRLPWRVLHQDDLPKPLLISEFADDESSCLFGTRGLWHGIDVPGPSLSLVVIDRIPFPRPDDPLLSARRDLVGSERSFREIDLPLAATELAQGAGRLVRRATDRGLVAVLDRRLATSRAYRWDLISALPDMPRTGDRDEALDFLARLVD